MKRLALLAALILAACTPAPAGAQVIPTNNRQLACNGLTQNYPWPGRSLSFPAIGYYTGPDVSGVRLAAFRGLDNAVWITHVYQSAGITAGSDFQRIAAGTRKSPKILQSPQPNAVRILVEGLDGHSWYLDLPYGAAGGTWHGNPDGGAYYDLIPLVIGAGNVTMGVGAGGGVDLLVQYVCRR